MMSTFAYSQELKIKNNQGGLLSLGVRSTFSTFNHGDFGNNGMGVGGQFRLQFADRVNSDWFFDYIQGNVGDFASRTDYHIGWSVLFYYLKNQDLRIRPYILAGHCFDYTKIVDNGDVTNFEERWSSAVQAGTGVHFNLTKRLDLSVVGQYMIHLGNHLEAHLDGNRVEFHDHGGGSLEGHLLFHVGVNYKIGDLW